jgi:hypothetical protein
MLQEPSICVGDIQGLLTRRELENRFHYSPKDAERLVQYGKTATHTYKLSDKGMQDLWDAISPAVEEVQHGNSIDFQECMKRFWPSWQDVFKASAYIDRTFCAKDEKGVFRTFSACDQAMRTKQACYDYGNWKPAPVTWMKARRSSTNWQL